MPAAAACAFGNTGFWSLEVKLSGPVQLNVLPVPLAVPVSFNVSSLHRGVLYPAAVPVGPDCPKTNTVVVSLAEQPNNLAVTI